MLGNDSKHTELQTQDKAQDILFENSTVWGTLFTNDSVQITYGRNIIRPDDIITTDLRNVYNEIKSDKLISQISSIRGCYFSYLEASNPDAHIWAPGQAEKHKEMYKGLKTKLPWICMATFIKQRSTPFIVSINGLILDFDGLADAEGFKEMVRDKILDAHIIFRSPTNGVKCVFVFNRPLVVDGNLYQVIEDYKYIYNTVRERVESILRVKADSSCQDPVRACFLSWDRCAIRRNVRLDIDAILDHGTHRKDGKDEKDKLNSEEDTLCLRDSVSLNSKDKKSVDSRLHGNDCVDDFAKAREVVTKLAQIRFDYKDFIKVGLALYAGFGDRGREVWDIFLSNPNYNDTPATLGAHWRSFAGVRNTKLATLFYVGRIYGCNPN